MSTSIPQNVVQCAFNFDALNTQPYEPPVYKPAQLSLFTIPAKICIVCKKEKGLEHFGINRYRVDGHKTRCKDCYNAYAQQRRKNNLERFRAYDRKWEKNPKRREYDRIRKQKPETKAYHRARKQNPQYKKSQSVYAINRYYEHHEEIKTRMQKWAQENPLKKAEIANRRRSRKIEAEVGKVSYKRILERDGLICHICSKGIDHTVKKGPASLAFDHVKPLAGKGDRKGTHSEDNIRPAHKVCNSRKGVKLLSEMSEWACRGPDIT